MTGQGGTCYHVRGPIGSDHDLDNALDRGHNMETGKMLFLGAGVAAIVGLLGAILHASALGDGDGTMAAAAFFEGAMWTLLVSGILLGLSAIVGSRR